MNPGPIATRTIVVAGVVTDDRGECNINAIALVVIGGAALNCAAVPHSKAHPGRRRRGRRGSIKAGGAMGDSATRTVPNPGRGGGNAVVAVSRAIRE